VAIKPHWVYPLHAPGALSTGTIAVPVPALKEACRVSSRACRGCTPACEQAHRKRTGATYWFRSFSLPGHGYALVLYVSCAFHENLPAAWRHQVYQIQMPAITKSSTITVLYRGRVFCTVSCAFHENLPAQTHQVYHCYGTCILYSKKCINRIKVLYITVL